ncbi:NRPS-like enzyme, putative [Talaromyces stipitatus ATCC 10500]|uniref:NRPS-like enzyme, putative n=1 Tax=Talaromyces stipitatus (strain ATCC 10500 / CBS 375.48 / QM 6759 / NRRL 1006) TaxID=441959 RepID=B8M3Z7_TALSN|nr:NRPS-like enzyme, putative [Talaromyces stipitatus ATCC 10500]EED20740.1 NRPS-like enzyme, putative [Talaromyces stipitatus ATCC 10500]
MEAINNLTQLLQGAAKSKSGLRFYKPVEDLLESMYVSYSDLLEDATEKARLLRAIEGLTPSTILLIHFDSQHEAILWFWAATIAGFLPAMSAPLVNDAAQRKKHLNHLQTLLRQPIILTAKHLLSGFDGVEGLHLYAVESLQDDSSTASTIFMAGAQKEEKELAVLMLTSGSTGNAKAVALRHGQILKALKGKTSFHGINPGDPFLNWIGMDHVANLTEIHLHAMSLGSDQVQVPAAELLRNPLLFIELLDLHKIVYTFSPNFFMAQVRDSLVANPTMKADLSHLRAFIAGAEASVVTTCDTLTRELRRFGVQTEVIRPGFGMTEICGGSIYSTGCPSYDLAAGLEFANLGTCIPGIEMRVMHLTDKSERVRDGEVGEFQVSGPVVFDHYFNNAEATASAFTADGWFITGDLAWIDKSGNLNLAGRTKDLIVINGIKWSSTDIEIAIEEEGIPGIVPSFTAAIPHRAADSATEDIAIIYSPAYAPEDDQVRFETATAIAKTVALNTSWKPAHVIPLPQKLLEKSTLGKISRSKVRSAFEKGEYATFEKEDLEARKRYQESKWRSPETETAKSIQKILAEILKIPAEGISLDSSIFDLGVSSFNLMLLKARVEDALETKIEIPLSVLLTEPTVGTIATLIEKALSETPDYNAIVPLQTQGTKTPLFCIHPGSGDIIVFIALAAHFPTRPVYAVRTRGYNPNERLFTSIRETVETYVRHIRQMQPKGPYAIAGYSLGSTIAYEVAKELEAQGQEVRFLASIDFPPHITHYIQGLDWIDVLLHISFYLELINETLMLHISPYMHTLDREEAVERILDISNPARMEALGLNAERLALITGITENLRVNLLDYKPTGTVDRMDVFVADPPSYAALDRQDWKNKKLGRWADFVRSSVEFHDCAGIHAKMLNREHMADFARIFKMAMKRRGV